ncbi:hypothetical protein B7939_01070 [Eggerthia catenaformis]|nr:hypothetical protein B7939_01070 [Eggerthia catenaformis]
MFLNKNLKYLRLKYGYSQDNIANRLGYKSFTTIQKWEDGTSEPSLEKLRILAMLYNVTLLDLTERDLQDPKSTPLGTTPVSITSIPLYGDICCGDGLFVEDDIMDTITLPDDFLPKKDTYFAQYAKGDSMINADIEDGDLLIFDKDSIVDHGQIGCFCVDDNMAVCKKIIKLNDGTILLQSANDDYPPIMVDLLENNFRSIGKLVRIIKRNV